MMNDMNDNPVQKGREAASVKTPEEIQKNAEHYFGQDGITFAAIKHFLDDSGSDPFPDFGRLFKLSQELPGSDELAKKWETLFKNEDFSTLLENPRQCIEKYGITSEMLNARIKEFKQRVDQEGLLKFPDPDALSNLVLMIANHLSSPSENPPMTDLDDAIKRNEEIIRQNETLLSQADTLVQERNQLLEQHGLTPDAVKRFIDSNYVSPGDREQIRKETLKIQEEIETRERQIENQYAAHATTSRTRKPRMNRLV